MTRLGPIVAALIFLVSVGCDGKSSATPTPPIQTPKALSVLEALPVARSNLPMALDALSADGTHLLIRSEGSGCDALNLLSLNGDSKVIANDAVSRYAAPSQGAARFSQDGTRVAYLASPSCDSPQLPFNLNVIDLVSGTTKTLETGVEWVWGWKDSSVLYSRDGLKSKDQSGESEEATITSARVVDVSEDGAAFVVYEARGQISLHSEDGRDYQLEGFPATPGKSCLSPGNRWYCFLSLTGEPALVIISASTGEQVTIPESEAQSADLGLPFNVAWSPDGTSLLVHSSTSGYQSSIIDPNSGQIVDVTMPSGVEFGPNIEWAGSVVAFRRDAQVWVAIVADGGSGSSDLEELRDNLRAGFPVPVDLTGLSSTEPTMSSP